MRRPSFHSDAVPDGRPTMTARRASNRPTTWWPGHHLGGTITRVGVTTCSARSCRLGPLRRPSPALPRPASTRPGWAGLALADGRSLRRSAVVRIRFKTTCSSRPAMRMSGPGTANISSRKFATDRDERCGGTWRLISHESTDAKTRTNAPLCGAFVLEKSGGVLLSQGVYPQVPSALAVLTSVFGMGTGVTLPL